MTGVQTCALPISKDRLAPGLLRRLGGEEEDGPQGEGQGQKAEEDGDGAFAETEHLTASFAGAKVALAVCARSSAG